MSQQENKKGTIRVPRELDEEAARFFRKMVSEFPWLNDPGVRDQLIAACNARSRYLQAGKAVKAHGLVCYDRFGQLRPRPEVAIESNARNQFYRFMAGLGLKKKKSPPQKTGARKR